MKTIVFHGINYNVHDPSKVISTYNFINLRALHNVNSLKLILITLIDFLCLQAYEIHPHLLNVESTLVIFSPL